MCIDIYLISSMLCSSVSVVDHDPDLPQGNVMKILSVRTYAFPAMVANFRDNEPGGIRKNSSECPPGGGEERGGNEPD